MRHALSRTSPLMRVAVGLSAVAALVTGADALWLRPMRTGIAGQRRALAAALREESSAAAAERMGPVLQQRVHALQGRLASMRVASSGDVDAAGVLRLLQTLAAESNLSITAFKPSPPSSGESLAETSVALEFEGTYHGLVRFLGLVADDRALLVVTSLRVGAHDRVADGVTLAGAARIAWFAPAPLTEAGPAPPGAPATVARGAGLQPCATREDDARGAGRPRCAAPDARGAREESP